MHPIYIYIKKFRNIIDQEIQFSDKYKVSFDPTLPFKKALHIQKLDAGTSSSVIFNHSQLRNVNVVVGKTGAGKTNIFQLFGMKQDERLDSAEPGDSYLFLYEDDSKSAPVFIIEPFDIRTVTALVDDPSVERRRSSYNREDDEYYDRMPDRVKEHFRLTDSMQMYSFNLDHDGYPTAIKSDYCGPDFDHTYIFSGYDRNAFAFCPFDEDREDHESDNDWIPREHAEYDKTALWSS